eukprot:GHVL01044053.1.p1 GENE.GHVL01044053.1~~GHVL01044053.1.p1  ORF type:complete len:260 (+),score=55.15 GHVL01044053.1:289-1068(+)
MANGISQACLGCDCSFLGGDSVLLPAVLTLEDYDAAGFCVGFVEESNYLPKKNEMQAGDVLIGLSSSGLHVTGYYTVRAILDSIGLTCEAPWKFDKHHSLVETFLTPSRVYVKTVIPLIESLKGAVNVSEGGLVGSLVEMIPETLRSEIDCQAWELPNVYKWLKVMGRLDLIKMTQTFNCGIGFILIVAFDLENDILKRLNDQGESAFTIGKLVNITDNNCNDEKNVTRINERFHFIDINSAWFKKFENYSANEILSPF